MAYVVTENCIKCKYGDCVEVCPVDCFYEGKNMLFINPEECIDCGVCEPECPAGAITPEKSDQEGLKWLEINKKYSALSPKITSKPKPYDDADKHLNEPDKFKKYFSENDQ